MTKRLLRSRIRCILKVDFEYRPTGWAYQWGEPNPSMTRLTPTIVGRARTTVPTVMMDIDPVIMASIHPMALPLMVLDAMGFELA